MRKFIALLLFVLACADLGGEPARVDTRSYCANPASLRNDLIQRDMASWEFHVQPGSVQSDQRFTFWPDGTLSATGRVTAILDITADWDGDGTFVSYSVPDRLLLPDSAGGSWWLAPDSTPRFRFDQQFVQWEGVMFPTTLWEGAGDLRYTPLIADAGFSASYADAYQTLFVHFDRCG